MKWSALLLVVGVAAPAHATVRSTTGAGTPLEWRQACPLLTLSTGPGAPVSLDQLRGLVDDAIAAWSAPGCSNLPLAVDGTTDDAPDVGWDGRNLVLWRPPGFCDDPASADDNLCDGAGILAVTTTFYYDRPGRPEDGALIEADLEINLAMAWATDGRPDAYDLPAVLTHELGHVLGFAHTCAPSGTTARDADGRPVPGCFPLSALPAGAVAATMYPYALPGEQQRRSPEPDETAALCALYHDRDATCERLTPGCGCTSGSSGAPPLVLIMLVALRLSLRRKP